MTGKPAKKAAIKAKTEKVIHNNSISFPYQLQSYQQENVCSIHMVILLPLRQRLRKKQNQLKGAVITWINARMAGDWSLPQIMGKLFSEYSLISIVSG